MDVYLCCLGDRDGRAEFIDLRGALLVVDISRDEWTCT
jgi:hypothetical protein